MATGPVKAVAAGGYTWSYREVEGTGVPVLFLHAFPLQKAMWEPVMDRLEGRAALAVDLPGFGGSRPVPEQPSMTGYAAGIAAFLDALGLDRVVPCGLSMGGYLAFAFWRGHRERVAGMILADTRAGADTPQAREGRLNLIARLKEEGSRAATQSLPGLLGRTTREQRPELLQELERWVLANPPEGIAAASQAMADRPDSTALLAEIDVPALVVVGEEDEISPPAEAEAMAAGLPRAELVRIPGAGHLTALEAPDAFAEAVREFLARIEG